MNIPITKSQTERKLRKLDFEISKKGKHCHASLKIDGRRVVITVFPHGRGELAVGTASAIRKQLYLTDDADFTDFRDCPLDYDRYLKILGDRGILGS